MELNHGSTDNSQLAPTVKISPCFCFILDRKLAASFPNSTACPSQGTKPLSSGGSLSSLEKRSIKALKACRRIVLQLFNSHWHLNSFFPARYGCVSVQQHHHLHLTLSHRSTVLYNITWLELYGQITLVWIFLSLQGSTDTTQKEDLKPLSWIIKEQGLVRISKEGFVGCFGFFLFLIQWKCLRFMLAKQYNRSYIHKC